MKKRLLLGTVIGLGCICGVCNISQNTIKGVYASSEEPPVVETEPVEEEQFTEEVKNWLSQHMDAQMVANIINWCSQLGLMGALFGVYMKYKKHKTTTLEDVVKAFKTEVEKYIKECFDNLSKEQINKLISASHSVEGKMNEVMKAFVLAQDKTVEGKVAMLDLIAKNTTDVEVVQIVSKEKEEIVKKQEITEKIKEVVSGEYIPVE